VITWRATVLASRAILVAAALLGSGAPRVHAQSAIYGAGLQAWLGCWSADLVTLRDGRAPSIVCIAPTSDANVADLYTVQDDRVVSRDVLDASGRRRAIAAERCTGVRSASWSRDGRRLFVRSSGRCAGVPSTTSGLLAITPDGDWLDVEGISAGGGAQVRVARYRGVAPPAALPDAARSALRAQSLATQSVRVAAGAPVHGDDVIEAAHAVDSAVVEAWILERAHRFEITDAEVGSLLRAGVPSRVADALAAVAEPDDYTLARGSGEPVGAPALASVETSYGLPLGWGWGWGYLLARGARHGGGYRDAWRYGWYRPPIVIVRGRESGRRGRERGRGDDWGRDGRGSAADPRRAGPSHTPPSGDPRHAPAQSGGTIRLGKPRG
jgi:hypothetical protein